jgi:hypothetical protein
VNGPNAEPEVLALPKIKGAIAIVQVHGVIGLCTPHTEIICTHSVVLNGSSKSREK